MNTGLRRFILRVAVGLLAFLLGVAVAWALGGLNPFQSYSGAGSYHKGCDHHRSWSSTESSLRPESDGRNLGFEGRSFKTKRVFVAMPPTPPPPPAAPFASGGS